MAFRTGYLPAEALPAAKFRAEQLKNWWLGARPKFTTQDTRADDLLSAVNELAVALKEWNRAAAVPGIGTYAQSQYEPEYDIAAEFTAMVAQAQSTFDWLITAWNANASDYLTLAEDGSRIIKTFTPAQLSEFVSRMDALAATIE